jgi:hypothetical protein
MSGENVEKHRHAIDGWNRRDLEMWLEFADPNIEFFPFSAQMEGKVYRGHDGIRRLWEDYVALYPNLRIDVAQMRDLGDVTLAHLQFRAADAGSDAPIAQEMWQAAEWRDGLCIWWHSFRTEEEAVLAAETHGATASPG